MEEKNTKRAGVASGWAGLILDSIMGSIQSFIGGIFGSAQEMATTFTKRIARQILLGLAVFLGSTFLLIGVAASITAKYQLPGIGEIFIGIFILSISLIAHLVTKDD